MEEKEAKNKLEDLHKALDAERAAVARLGKLVDDVSRALVNLSAAINTARGHG